MKKLSVILSLFDVLICGKCGHKVKRHIMESSEEYQQIAVGERRNCHPDDRSQAEIEFVCPECGAKDPFTEVDYDV